MSPTTNETWTSTERPWYVRLYVYWMVAVLFAAVTSMIAFMAAMLALLLPARGMNGNMWMLILAGVPAAFALAQRLRRLVRDGRRVDLDGTTASDLHPPPWMVAAFGMLVAVACALYSIAVAAVGQIGSAVLAIAAALVVGSGSISGLAWAWKTNRQLWFENLIGGILTGMAICLGFWWPRVGPPAPVVWAPIATWMLILGSWIMATSRELMSQADAGASQGGSPRLRQNSK